MKILKEEWPQKGAKGAKIGTPDVPQFVSLLRFFTAKMPFSFTEEARIFGARMTNDEPVRSRSRHSSVSVSFGRLVPTKSFGTREGEGGVYFYSRIV
jgi:hypothetical protein